MMSKMRPASPTRRLARRPMTHPRFAWAVVVKEGATTIVAPVVCTVTV